MKTYLQTYLIISILGIFTAPVASMEKIVVANTATSLEGVMSLNIASGLTPVKTDILKLDQTTSIDVLNEPTSTLPETDATPEFVIDNVGDPPISPVVLPLIQF